MTVKMLAEALNLSPQAIANALTYLGGAGLVVEEPSTFRGFRFQYRLATEEERRAKLAADAGEGGEA